MRESRSCELKHSPKQLAFDHLAGSRMSEKGQSQALCTNFCNDCITRRFRKVCKGITAESHNICDGAQIEN